MGELVHVAFSKWGGVAHWECDAVRLGQDSFGVWLHLPQGTAVSRPGYAFDTPVEAVSLMPHGTPAVPTFYVTEDAPPEVTFRVYVDVTTPPVWDGDVVSMVDLDLDVVEYLDGRIAVLDEDEFAVNQVAYAYPDDLTALARASCDNVAEAMRTEQEPYRCVGRDWLLFAAAESQDVSG